MRKGAITQEAVLKAIAEYDQPGPDGFLEMYGFYGILGAGSAQRLTSRPQCP